MVKAWIDRIENKIKIQTDDPSVRYFLEVTKKVTEYIPYQKRWMTITKTYKIYDSKKTVQGICTYTLGKGWAGYIANTFSPYISGDEYNDILSSILSETYRDTPFPELRDYQNEDVLHMLKYKIGLCGVYTSYGKTQVIATLANYAYGLGKKVLLVAPGKKALDELVKRCKNVFGLDIPSKDGRIKAMITSGLLNRLDYKDPDKRLLLEKEIASFDWIMVDEVEYTINDSGEYLFSCCTGAECFYAFSGTASKKDGAMISFVNGLDDVVIENRNLVKFFGPNLVYRMPLSLDIDAISVKTMAFSMVKFDESDLNHISSNIYMNVMNKIFTNDEVCKVIVKIAKKFPKLYIPINNLASIIDNWINNYFLGKFRILLICGEGYIYYDLDGNRTKLKDLQEAWNYVNDGKVDVIPSTSSGYRALDLPGLENILLIQGKVAGVVLQSVGRTARGKHMNILWLESKLNTKIPVYSKGLEERNEMIHQYYKYCNIKDSIINEEDL